MRAHLPHWPVPVGRQLDLHELLSGHSILPAVLLRGAVHGMPAWVLRECISGVRALRVLGGAQLQHLLKHYCLLLMQLYWLIRFRFFISVHLVRQHPQYVHQYDFALEGMPQLFTSIMRTYLLYWSVPGSCQPDLP